MPTPGDLLLYWISDRKRVSHRLAVKARKGLEVRWQYAVTATTRGPSIATDRQEPIRRDKWWFRDLWRLGHVERITYDATNKVEWVVVPPTFIWIEDGCAFACGVRTPELVKSLQAVFGASQILESPGEGEAPSHLQVLTTQVDFRNRVNEASNDQLDCTFREQCRFGKDRGLELLGSVPRLEVDYSQLRTYIGDASGQVYDPQSGRWRESQDVSSHLASITRTKSPRRYLLWDAHQQFYLELGHEDLLAAQWSLRRSCPTVKLHYDSSRRELAVPASPGLPLIVERGLIMASGLLPIHTRGVNTYARIDQPRAAELARILGIPLDVSHRSSTAGLSETL